MSELDTQSPDYPRHGVRTRPSYRVLDHDLTETDTLRSEHTVIETAGGKQLRLTGGKTKPGVDPEQIEADWQAALAYSAALAASYRSRKPKRAAKITAPRSRTPRPAAPHRRGSRRSADKDDDPDDGGDDGRLCWGCNEPLIGYRRQAKFHGEECRSKYRRDEARAEAAVTPMAPRPLPRKVCRCRADIVLLADDLGIRCTTCAKRRPVATADRPSAILEREMAAAA